MDPNDLRETLQDPNENNGILRFSTSHIIPIVYSYFTFTSSAPNVVNEVNRIRSVVWFYFPDIPADQYDVLVVEDVTGCLVYVRTYQPRTKPTPSAWTFSPYQYSCVSGSVFGFQYSGTVHDTTDSIIASAITEGVPYYGMEYECVELKLSKTQAARVEVVRKKLEKTGPMNDVEQEIQDGYRSHALGPLIKTTTLY